MIDLEKFVADLVKEHSQGTQEQFLMIGIYQQLKRIADVLEDRQIEVQITGDVNVKNHY